MRTEEISGQKSEDKEIENMCEISISRKSSIVRKEMKKEQELKEAMKYENS